MSTLASKLLAPFRLTPLANHFPALHGARVLAILSVIQLHVTFELGALGALRGHGQFYDVCQRIFFGVDLFFFLSGFLIGTNLLQPGAMDARGIKRFYGRRTLRILPLYYVVLTVLALTRTLDPHQKANLWREYAYLTNYTNTYQVVMFWGWTLCVEEHFYVLGPLLMAGLKRLPSHRSRILALASLWFSGFVVRAAIASTFTGKDPREGFQQLYLPTHTRYDTLIAGVLLAYLWHTERERIEAFMAKSWAQLASLALSGILLALLVSLDKSSLGGLWGLISYGTVTGIGYTNLFIYLITTKGLLARVLGHRVFAWFAALGYGVYLTHMPLVLLFGLPVYLRLVFVLKLPVLIALLAAVLTVFALSLVVSYVLHLLVEKPVLFLRDTFLPSKPSNGPVPSPASTS
jgi:peptidoglycan/LPS O-acetylase OafA/YrhL